MNIRNSCIRTSYIYKTWFFSDSVKNGQNFQTRFLRAILSRQKFKFHKILLPVGFLGLAEPESSESKNFYRVPYLVLPLKLSGIETQKSGTGRGHPIDEFDEALRLYKNCLSCTRHYLEEPNCIPELVLYNADPDDVNYKCGKILSICLCLINHKQKKSDKTPVLCILVFSF